MKTDLFVNLKNKLLFLIPFENKPRKKKFNNFGRFIYSKYPIEKSFQTNVKELPELLKTNKEIFLGNHVMGCNFKNIKFFDTRKTHHFINEP